MQCYIYYERYRLDRQVYKIMVHTVWLPCKIIFLTSAPILFDSIRLRCYGSYLINPSVDPQTPKFIFNPYHRLLEAIHSFCSLHFFYHYGIRAWGMVSVIVEEPIVWSVILSSRDSY